MSPTPAEQILLTSASDQKIGARIVRYGQKFGKDLQYTHDSAVPVIEFRLGGWGPRSPFLGAFIPDLFENISQDVRFSPDGSLQNALPLAETERLFRWLESLDVISTQLI
jgi:hypothetical protein